jgi:pentatricopeptide repeat protein
MINVRQFIPTAVVLGCMTSALVQVGCADDAFALVKEWTSTVQPNQVVYTMLLRGFVESDRLDMGLEVVKAMHAVGLPVTRNIHSLILEGFVRSGDGEGVAMWVKNMDNENVQFDMKIITILAKHYCVAGAFEDCLELLKEVSRQDRKKAVDKRAQTMAFDKLVDCLVRTERYAEAAALVEKIDEFDVQPSKFTLASVVTLWGCSRQLDKAFAAVESLTKKYDISPNNLVRMCLLKSCLANNDISRALRVFKIMRSTSEGAGRKAFEAMICGCAELGWHMESVRLVEEAFGLNGVAPTFGPDDMDFSVLETVAKSLDAAGLMESLGKPLFLRLREKQRVDVPAH